MSAVHPAVSAPKRTQPNLFHAGQILSRVLAVILAVLGLLLAALCLGRFGALGGGGPLWLGTLAAAEVLAGQLTFGAKYTAWDSFYRALALALLASLSLGMAAWAWPRRRAVRVVATEATPATAELQPELEPEAAALYSFKYRPETTEQNSDSIREREEAE